MIVRNASKSPRSSKIFSTLENSSPKRAKSEKTSQFNKQRFLKSHLSDHQQSYIKALKNFEKLCAAYYSIPDIEIEKLKKVI